MIEWDLYKEQVFDKDGQEVCLHATIPFRLKELNTRVGQSYMYLIIHLRQKGIYHGAIDQTKKTGLLYTLSIHINLNFVFLDDPICIYKVASELVSSTLCSL